MEKTFQFGKIDYNGTGRRINLVTVDVNLKNNRDGFPVFTASIDVWNGRGTDIITGGQAFRYVPKVPENNDLYQEIVSLWKKYHLNDTNAGTKAQEDALKKSGISTSGWNYKESCDYLKKKGLYEVKLTPTEKKYNPRYAGAPYRYGSGWIYRPIPASDLAKIKRIMALPASTRRS